MDCSGCKHAIYEKTVDEGHTFYTIEGCKKEHDYADITSCDDYEYEKEQSIYDEV